MSLSDTIRALEKAIADLNRRINDKISLSGNLPSHHTTHELLGADSIKLDDLKTPDDNTDLNATIARHGLLRKLDNDPLNYLNGLGGWAVPAGGGGGASTYYNPDKLPSPPTSQSDHFDNESLDAKWVEFDPGVPAITLAEAGHHLKITHATEGAPWKYRGVYQTLPSGNFTITAKVRILCRSDKACGIALGLFQDADHNPATCDIVVLQFRTNVLGWVSYLFTDYGTWSATYFTSSPGHAPFVGSYLRIRRNSTTLYFDISHDGVGWVRYGSVAQPFAAEQFGILTTNENSGENIYGWCDWIYYENADNFLPIGGIG